MGIKDLFGKRSNKIVTKADLEKLTDDVESYELVAENSIKNRKLIPRIDYSDPKNFANYGNAERYYTDSIAYIHNTYPYDGSVTEKMKWRNEASGLDEYLLDLRYPKAVGHVRLNSSVSTGATYAEAGKGTWFRYTAPQHIKILGGPNKDIGGSEGDPFEFSKQFPAKGGKANIWDEDSYRESNLGIRPSLGNTIEFWSKTGDDAWVAAGRAVCLFDLWNGQAHGTANYVRFMVEILPSSGQDFTVTYKYGNAAEGAERIGINLTTATKTSLGANWRENWQHYAFVVESLTAGIKVSLYVNGTYEASATAGAQITSDVPQQAFVALINGLRTKPVSGSPASLTEGDGGAPDIYFDEFRYWKAARNAKQIGRNWFTTVAGGTNTDNNKYDDVDLVDLGVYYKFNEGVLDSTMFTQSQDATVLDYSGRITNGNISNYSVAVRQTTSAMDAAIGTSLGVTEVGDPVMYSYHPDILSLKTELALSGSTWDYQNNASIYHSIPAWVTEQDGDFDGRVSELSQTLASYFDSLHQQIGALVTNSEARYFDLSDTQTKPYYFAKSLLRSHGFDVTDIFTEATLLEEVTSRGEQDVFDQQLQNIKNVIYQNIYNNLPYIYKSKGTEKSFRNLIRCFGVDDELVKLNLYADGVDYTLEGRRKYTSLKKNYVDFNHTDRKDGVVYSCDTAPSSTDERGYIAAPTVTYASATLMTDSGSGLVGKTLVLTNYDGTTHTITGAALGAGNASTATQFNTDEISHANSFAVELKESLDAAATAGNIDMTVSAIANTTGAGPQPRVITLTQKTGGDTGNTAISGTLISGNKVICNNTAKGGPHGTKAFLNGDWNEAKYLSTTLTAEVLFPRFPQPNDAGYRNRSQTIFSLFGISEANLGGGKDPHDAAGLKNVGAFQIQALKGFDDLGGGVIRDPNSTNAQFKLIYTDEDGTHELITDEYKGVYDNNKWNFAVRLTPVGADLSDYVSGATVNQYKLEFHGVQMTMDVKENEFTKTATFTGAIPVAKARAMVATPKVAWCGQHRTDFDNIGSASSVFCDVKITNLMYWFDYLSDDEIASHAMDTGNTGRSYPNDDAYAFFQKLSDGTTSDIRVPRKDTLALHWDFTNVTQTDGSGLFTVNDISLGGASYITENRYGWFTNLIGYRHQGRGSFDSASCANDTEVINREYQYSARQRLPEILSGDDMVEIRTQDDNTFGKDARPINHFWAIEKSMSQVISEEMLSFFATVVEFNDLIGQPVHRYRLEYKGLQKFRSLFYERVDNIPSFEKFVSFYKWIDSSLGLMMQQLVPASGNFSESMRNMVENHLLERSKYWTKFPTLEMKQDPPEGTIRGIRELTYDWEHGHAPVSVVSAAATVMVDSATALTGQTLILENADGSKHTITGVARGAGNPSTATEFNTDEISHANNFAVELKESLDAAFTAGNIKMSVSAITNNTTGDPRVITLTQARTGHTGNTLITGTLVDGNKVFINNTNKTTGVHGTKAFVGGGVDSPDHCLWWNERAERTWDGFLTAVNVETDREKIRKSIVRDILGQNKMVPVGTDGFVEEGDPTLYDIVTSKQYEGSTYATRRLSRPYKLNLEQSMTITGGPNFANATPASPNDMIRSSTQMGHNVQFFQNEDDAETCRDDYAIQDGHLKEKRRAHVVKLINTLTTVQTEVKGSLITHPLYGAYPNDASTSEKNNTHDSYGQDHEIPMQGVFAAEWVGGNQHRHIDLNKGTDAESNRAELYKATGGTLKHPHDVNTAHPAARWTRDGLAKRPFNIANINTAVNEDNYTTYSGTPKLGNYTKDYEIVQTSARSLNNRWLVKNPTYDYSASKSASTYVIGAYDFTLPDRTKDSANNSFGRTEHVFVERFSAPGSPATLSRGALDIEAEEMSPYNSLNYRNLRVRQHLNFWHKEHTKQFGYREDYIHGTPADYIDADGDGSEDAGESNDFGGNTPNVGAWHKNNRNPLTRMYLQAPSQVETRRVYDNFHIGHQIPRSDWQYHWITSSAVHFNVDGQTALAEYDDERRDAYTPTTFPWDNDGDADSADRLLTHPRLSGYISQYPNASIGVSGSLEWSLTGQAGQANSYSAPGLLLSGSFGIESVKNNILTPTILDVDFYYGNYVIVDDVDFANNTVGAYCPSCVPVFRDFPEAEHGTGQKLLSDTTGKATAALQMNSAMTLTGKTLVLTNADGSTHTITGAALGAGSASTATQFNVDEVPHADGFAVQMKASLDAAIAAGNLKMAASAIRSNTQGNPRIVDLVQNQAGIGGHTAITGTLISENKILLNQAEPDKGQGLQSFTYKASYSDLNARLLNRNGPYQGAGWKMLKSAENPLVRAQRRRNTISVQSKPESNKLYEVTQEATPGIALLLVSGKPANGFEVQLWFSSTPVSVTSAELAALPADAAGGAAAVAHKIAGKISALADEDAPEVIVKFSAGGASVYIETTSVGAEMNLKDIKIKLAAADLTFDGDGKPTSASKIYFSPYNASGGVDTAATVTDNGDGTRTITGLFKGAMDETKTSFRYNDRRSDNHVKYVEPPASWNKPMVHTISEKSDNVGVNVLHSYSNNLEAFANPLLTWRLDFVKSNEQFYDRLLEKYSPTTATKPTLDFVGLQYKEYIFPKHRNVGLLKVRGRVKWDDISSLQEAATPAGDLRVFWKHNIFERIKGGLLESPVNALGYASQIKDNYLDASKIVKKSDETVTDHNSWESWKTTKSIFSMDNFAFTSGSYEIQVLGDLQYIGIPTYLSWIVNRSCGYSSETEVTETIVDGLAGHEVPDWWTGTVDEDPDGEWTDKCLLAGTLIETSKGRIPVEQISSGDQVLSYDFDKKEMGYFNVTDVMPPSSQPRWSLVTLASGKTLRCTTSHPLYTLTNEDNEMPISQASIGAIVYVYNGTSIVEDTIELIEYIEEEVVVYNFEVEGVHSYISDNILSHNKTVDPGDDPPGVVLDGPGKSGREIDEPGEKADEIPDQLQPMSLKYEGSGRGTGWAATRKVIPAKLRRRTRAEALMNSRRQSPRFVRKEKRLGSRKIGTLYATDSKFQYSIYRQTGKPMMISIGGQDRRVNPGVLGNENPNGPHDYGKYDLMLEASTIPTTVRKRKAIRVNQRCMPPEPVVQLYYNPFSPDENYREAAWLYRTHDLSGKTPWYDKYIDFSLETRAMAQNYGLVAEFRVSEHMDKYLMQDGGDFRTKNYNFLSLHGASYQTIAPHTAVLETQYSGKTTYPSVKVYSTDGSMDKLVDEFLHADDMYSIYTGVSNASSTETLGAVKDMTVLQNNAFSTTDGIGTPGKFADPANPDGNYTDYHMTNEIYAGGEMSIENATETVYPSADSSTIAASTPWTNLPSWGNNSADSGTGRHRYFAWGEDLSAPTVVKGETGTYKGGDSDSDDLFGYDDPNASSTDIPPPYRESGSFAQWRPIVPNSYGAGVSLKFNIDGATDEYMHGVITNFDRTGEDNGTMIQGIKPFGSIAEVTVTDAVRVPVDKVATLPSAPRKTITDASTPMTISVWAKPEAKFTCKETGVSYDQQPVGLYVFGDYTFKNGKVSAANCKTSGSWRKDILNAKVSFGMFSNYPAPPEIREKYPDGMGLTFFVGYQDSLKFADNVATAASQSLGNDMLNKPNVYHFFKYNDSTDTFTPAVLPEDEWSSVILQILPPTTSGSSPPKIRLTVGGSDKIPGESVLYGIHRAALLDPVFEKKVYQTVPLGLIESNCPWGQDAGGQYGSLISDRQAAGITSYKLGKSQFMDLLDLSVRGMRTSNYEGFYFHGELMEFTMWSGIFSDKDINVIKDNPCNVLEKLLNGEILGGYTDSAAGSTLSKNEWGDSTEGVKTLPETYTVATTGTSTGYTKTPFNVSFEASRSRCKLPIWHRLGVLPTYNIQEGCNDWDDEFFNTYVHTDTIQFYDAIVEDHDAVSDTTRKRIRLKINALKKLLPYRGFYPQDRTLQLAKLFRDKMIFSIQGEETTVLHEEQAMQAALQPFFAPGILYNSIKAGIAVDWPAFTNETGLEPTYPHSEIVLPFYMEDVKGGSSSESMDAAGPGVLASSVVPNWYSPRNDRFSALEGLLLDLEEEVENPDEVLDSHSNQQRGKLYKSQPAYFALGYDVEDTNKLRETRHGYVILQEPNTRIPFEGLVALDSVLPSASDVVESVLDSTPEGAFKYIDLEISGWEVEGTEIVLTQPEPDSGYNNLDTFTTGPDAADNWSLKKHTITIGDNDREPSVGDDYNVNINFRRPPKGFLIPSPTSDYSSLPIADVLDGESEISLAMLNQEIAVKLCKHINERQDLHFVAIPGYTPSWKWGQDFDDCEDDGTGGVSNDDIARLFPTVYPELFGIDRLNFNLEALDGWDDASSSSPIDEVCDGACWRQSRMAALGVKAWLPIEMDSVFTLATAGAAPEVGNQYNGTWRIRLVYVGIPRVEIPLTAIDLSDNEVGIGGTSSDGTAEKITRNPYDGVYIDDDKNIYNPESLEHVQLSDPPQGGFINGEGYLGTSDNFVSCNQGWKGLHIINPWRSDTNRTPAGTYYPCVQYSWYSGWGMDATKSLPATWNTGASGKWEPYSFFDGGGWSAMAGENKSFGDMCSVSITRHTGALKLARWIDGYGWFGAPKFSQDSELGIRYVSSSGTTIVGNIYNTARQDVVTDLATSTPTSSGLFGETAALIGEASISNTTNTEDAATLLAESSKPQQGPFGFYGGWEATIITPVRVTPKPYQMYLMTPEYYMGHSYTDGGTVTATGADGTPELQTGNWARGWQNYCYPYFEYLGSNGDSRFEMAMHNFLAEVPNFFLKNKKLVSFSSKPEHQFKTMEAGTTYYMDVTMYQSEGFCTVASPYSHPDALGNPKSAALGTSTDGKLTMEGRYYGPAFRWKAVDDYNSDEIAKQVIRDPAQAPYVPPYLYGKAVARISFTANETRKYSLEEIFSGVNVDNHSNEQFARFLACANEDERLSGESILVQTSANRLGIEQSPAWKARTTISASMNLFGKTATKQVRYSAQLDQLRDAVDESLQKFVPQTADDPAESNHDVWVIGTKFECPILNFYNEPTLSTMVTPASMSAVQAISARSPAIINPELQAIINSSQTDYTVVQQTLNSGTGIWAGYGRIPSLSEGVFITVEETLKQREDFSTPKGESVGSLIDVCGFTPEKQKVGEIAEVKEISEAIVMIPFVDKPSDTSAETCVVDGRHFFKISKELFNLQKSNIENGKDAVAAGEWLGVEQNIPETSITKMIRGMKRYNIPPKFDFVRYPMEASENPFVMYIFEFHHRLSSQDLADIWQGVPPTISNTAEHDSSIFVHDLSPVDFFEENTLPKHVRWMTFKVKLRAKDNYFDSTAKDADDKRFEFNFELGKMAPKYSYNWPYDFFTMLEMIQVEAGLDIIENKSLNIPQVVSSQGELTASETSRQLSQVKKESSQE